MTLPARLAPYAVTVAAAVGCYDIDTLPMPGPLMTPAAAGAVAVPVADYASLILLDGDPVLVTTVSGVHVAAEPCPGDDPPTSWLDHFASASAVQFPLNALIDTG